MKTSCSLYLLLFIIMPLIGMENDRIIRFAGDHQDYPVISIKESNLCLIRNLHKHYQKHQNIVKNGGIVPCYQHVSGQAISLVNDALNVRPDKFADFYNRLTPFGQDLLFQASDQYDKKKIMLDVPEITKRFIDLFFPPDLRRHFIKKYFGKDDEDHVRNYFKERLISSKRLLSLKQPILISDFIPDNICLGSLFFNAAHTIDQYDYPIPLRIENDVHQTYAFSFGSNNCEYRVTDVKNKQCLLWVINHDNPSATFSTLIKHKHPTKGCQFSKTILRQAQDERDIEYLLTYSEHDMVFSIITTQNGLSFVESKAVDIAEGQIVNVCFDPVNHSWFVVLYESLASVFQKWNTQGGFIKQSSFLPFKKYGLFEKMMIYKTSSQYRLLKLCGVAELYAIHINEASDDGNYYHKDSTALLSVGQHNEYYSYSRELITTTNGIHVISLKDYFFVENNSESFFDMWSQPNTETHQIYSPDGVYLMCNALKRNKLGILYVETVIKDAVTRKEILSIDTLYSTFRGVGFTYDSTELIFLDKLKDSKVSLLNQEDKQILSEVEDIAFDNLGVTSLLKRLCMECRETGIVSLHKDDQVRAMLMDWSKKSPAMLKFLETCLPLIKIQK